MSPPLSSSVATTESVVVEIEEAPPITESHKRLKRATTLEIFSTDAASVTTPPAAPASKVSYYCQEQMRGWSVLLRRNDIVLALYKHTVGARFKRRRL